MKIGVSLIPVIPGKIGGMEQYVRNLLSYSTNAKDGHTWYLFLAAHNFHTFQAQGNVQKVMIMQNASIDQQLHRWIQGLRLDLWFCPLLVLQPADVTIPSVINIPDIQHEYYPQFFEPNILKWRLTNYRSSAQRSNAVLTLSEYSRQTILHKFQLPPQKVHTIHLDASKEFALPFDAAQSERVLQKYQLTPGYGFYPANTWHHKNHLNLLKALVLLRDNHGLRIPMVFTGSSQEAHESVMAYISQNQLWDQIKWLSYVPQNEMPYLYRHAGFLCFPSLFEGFGIPLVEAMRAQIPIISSNCGSIPEVVGDASLLFDPIRPDDIAAKLSAIQQPEIREDLIAKGNAQAKRFSWEKCARDTLAVFRSVARK
ncbi:glycosyltransferase family 4 protein [Brevibacillus sp. GCM10020057]|uniref:glycosyltransferase family 4 protein n=1 Tax=Brevibacillus sp. GCM10020057 TaxID=3317327 RepID=UPI003633A15C